MARGMDSWSSDSMPTMLQDAQGDTTVSTQQDDESLVRGIPGDDIDLVAKMRGLCIHWIRYGIRHRHDPGASKETTAILVRVNVMTLRAIGRGPVLMPERRAGGVLGEPMDWWGPLLCMPCMQALAGRGLNIYQVALDRGFQVQSPAMYREMLCETCALGLVRSTSYQCTGGTVCDHCGLLLGHHEEMTAKCPPHKHLTAEGVARLRGER